MAEDARPVRDPRQRGHVPADAGGTRRAALAELARALADHRGARRGVGRRRDPGMARARLQPARARTPSRRAPGRGPRLARRPDRAARRRALYRGCGGVLRVRTPRPPDRRQRAPRLRAHGLGLLARRRPGADGSRQGDLSCADPALRRLSARGAPVHRAAAASSRSGGRDPSRARSASGAPRRFVPSSPAHSRKTPRPSTRSRATGSCEWTETPCRSRTSRVPSGRCWSRTSRRC